MKVVAAAEKLPYNKASKSVKIWFLSSVVITLFLITLFAWHINITASLLDDLSEKHKLEMVQTGSANSAISHQDIFEKRATRHEKNSSSLVWTAVVSFGGLLSLWGITIFFWRKQIRHKRHVEYAVRETVVNFRNFFDSMDDMALVADTESRIIYANHACECKLKYPAGELTAKKMVDLYAADQKSEAEKSLTRVFDEQEETCSLPFIKKDGTELPVEANGWRGKWNRVACLFVIAKDLSAEHEADQRFECLFRFNPSPMALTRYDDRTIVDINEPFTTATGFSRREVIGKTSEDIGLFNDPAEYQRVGEMLRTSQRFSNYETRIKCNDGSVLDGLFSADIITFRGEKYVITVMIDITKRKATERETRHRAHFEHLISRLSSDFISMSTENTDTPLNHALSTIGEFTQADRAYVFRLDDNETTVTNTHEWCAENIAPQIENLQHLPCLEIPWWIEKLKALETIYIPSVSDLPEEKENEREILEAQDIKSVIVVPIPGSSGLLGFLGFDSVKQHRQWNDNDQALLRFVGEIMAHTFERQDAEQKLRKNKRAFKQTLESLNESVIQIDRDYVIRLNNRTSSALMNIPRDKFYGRKCYELFYGQDKICKDCPVKEAFETGQQVSALRYFSDGRVIVRNVYPIYNEQKTLTGATILSSDITERKKAEKGLEETNEKLQATLRQLQETKNQVIEQERQRALTTMASGIAHDFNNALSPIQGFVDLLLENPETRMDDEKVTRYLHYIRTSVENASQTVARMRKFYRPNEERALVAVDLNRVISEAVSITQPRWREEAAAEGKYVDIKTDLDNAANIKGNEAELHEVLVNLIFNSVDAMHSGGTIGITTQAKNEAVELVFSDDGEGMSEATKTKCFEPFFTTKGAEGSGLGLATVQGIVHRHNGTLQIETAEGSGTVFRITIPVDIAEHLPEESEKEDKSQGEQEKYRLLVVEDNNTQAEFLRDFCEQNGHTAIIAETGKDALEYFYNHHFDVVLTDRAMPAMSGDKLAAQIKEMCPDKPVIMITGFGSMMEAAGEMPDNVDKILNKPVPLKELRSALSELLQADAAE